jgi:hypothetical protein
MSRLWKFEGNETFEDAEQLLSKAKSEKKSFPITV